MKKLFRNIKEEYSKKKSKNKCRTIKLEELIVKTIWKSMVVILIWD